jgi:phospholipid-translocating ATPase
MPRGHEYHQPNAPDSIPDEPDSDIELDLHELGPSEYDRHGRGSYGRVGVHIVANEENQIPLRVLNNESTRPPGRRVKKFEQEYEQEGSIQDQDHNRQGSISFNIGDSTPLLQENENGQAVETKPNSSRKRFCGLGRRDGYQNLGESSQENEEPGKFTPRTIQIGQYPPPKFPPNSISNAKYTPWSFLPHTLYNEFSFFINLYFLIVALSQLIPDLRIGVLWTYMAPLGFVLCVTLGKEAYDDVIRRRRDAEANRELYTVLKLRGQNMIYPGKRHKGRKLKSRRAQKENTQRLDAISEEEEETGGSMLEVDEIPVKAKDIKVGDVLKLGKNDRVPADVVILKSYTSETSAIPRNVQSALPIEVPELLFDQEGEASSNKSAIAPIRQTDFESGSDGNGVGETFIRTDQLDGETDWKLRIASPLTQSLHPSEFIKLTITAGKPSKKVNEFLGRIELAPKAESNESNTNLSAGLSIDNTAWANTVLASNATVLAAVVYTGAQTRQALSTAPSRSKVGLLELEINNLTKILCLLTVTLSGVLVILQAYYKELQIHWYVSVCRYLILFSSIIPISLRVNLDIGKTVYAYYIHHDKDMPEAVVRTSTIPEDLGRIEYLLSDKTGTLTQNGKLDKLKYLDVS